MPNKPAIAAAEAANAIQSFSMEAFIKASKENITMSNEALKGVLRGAEISEVTVKDVESASIGIANSSIRKGEFFRIVGLKKVKTAIAGVSRESLIAIVQDLNGDQRPVYLSTLFRTPPMASNDLNTYTDEQINFDMGVLQNTSGQSVPKRLEKLIGDGKQYLQVGDDMQYTTTARRTVDTGIPGQEAGSEVIIQNRVFNLTHISEADAKAAFDEAK